MNNSDNFTDIIKNLESFQNIKASQSLHKKIEKDMLLLSTKRSRSYSPFFALRLAAIIIAILLVSTGGLVYAAEKSKPGTLLYPVKKQIDAIKVTFTKDPGKKTELHLNNAENSIHEIKKSLEDNNVNDISNKSIEYEKEVEKAVEEMEKNSKGIKGVSDKAQEKLQDNVEELEEIKKSAPSRAHSAIDNAIKKSEEGKEKAEESSNNNEGKNNGHSTEKENSQDKQSNNDKNEKGGE